MAPFVFADVRPARLGVAGPQPPACMPACCMLGVWGGAYRGACRERAGSVQGHEDHPLRTMRLVPREAAPYGSTAILAAAISRSRASAKWSLVNFAALPSVVLAKSAGA